MVPSTVTPPEPSTEISRCRVPKMTASVLSALSRSEFSRNHEETASVQLTISDLRPECISVQIHRCSISSSVLTVLGHPLPAFQEIEFVVSILRIRSLTALTAHFLLENSLQMRFAPHHFSWRRSLIDSFFSFVKGMFINKLWRNKYVALMTLHWVSCRVGLLHLLGSGFGTLENICTKFTHISQKWFYFSVNYTFYLHISLGRRNWLRYRGAVFWPTLYNQVSSQWQYNGKYVIPFFGLKQK